MGSQRVLYIYIYMRIYVYIVYENSGMTELLLMLFCVKVKALEGELVQYSGANQIRFSMTCQGQVPKPDVTRVHRLHRCPHNYPKLLVPEVCF